MGTARCKGGQCAARVFGGYSGDYRIITTDYNKYALVYSCEDFFLGSVSGSFVWILSKSKTMKDKDKEKVLSQIEELLPSYKTKWLRDTQ